MFHPSRLVVPPSTSARGEALRVARRSGSIFHPPTLIIHKMGQGGIFLTYGDIAFGVDALIEFMGDGAGVESHRPPAPPNGQFAVNSVVTRQSPDGVNFQLAISSRRLPVPAPGVMDAAIEQFLARITAGQESPTIDLGVDMCWYSEPSLEEMLYSLKHQPRLEPETSRADNWRPWRLDLRVCELCHPWIDPARDRELRKIRSVLDGFARPRVILPATDVASFREDYIALIALFAAKGKCLAPQDEQLPIFFRSFCDRVFRRGLNRGKLSDAEWHSVVDRVFVRLYSGKVGMGFTMPAFPKSFRAYVARALRGETANARCGHQRALKRGPFPSSLTEAATNLGVSHMTVRRHMSGLGFREWTEEAWNAISSVITVKKRWQEVETRLRAAGFSEETARKRVQRWKKSGMTPELALQRSASPKLPRGTCASCGEEHAVGALYDDSFYCSECLAEKTGRSPTE